MIRAHVVRLDPTEVQARLLAQTCGYARLAYNAALADFKAGLDEGVWRSVPTLKRRFNAGKDDQIPWCRWLSQHAAKNAIMDLGRALDNWLRDRKKPKQQRRFRFPRFHKRGHKDSYRASNGAGTVRVDGKTVWLPRIGTVRMRECLRWQGSVREVTVSRRAGRWYASFVVEDGAELPTPAPGAGSPVVGVDVGVGTLATCCDGTRHENPKALKRYLRKLRRLNKQLSRQCKGSHRRFRTKQRLARTHKRVLDVRSDAHHKATSTIVKTAGTVCIETLNVVGMVKNRRLSRAVSDAGLGGFLDKLRYKCDWQGKRLVEADRWYASSKRCSGCGVVKEVLPLSEREYVCMSCGLVIDRDLNAALNLKQVAASSADTLNGRGDGVSPSPMVAAAVREASTSKTCARFV